LPVYGTLPELRLLDQDSHPFQAAQLRGRVWITSFMFTSCPMECPILAQRMSYLQKLLSGRSPSIQLLSISVNPGQDTPVVLREYGTRFHRDPARWTFLTGESDPVLRVVSAAYDRGVSSKKTPGGFAALHGDRLVLIDGDGQIRGYYRKDDAEVARLLADADRLASRLL
jgi:cytochrome oxidase Cu insertion factor (SCO1/SenC/PrrC family)